MYDAVYQKSLNDYKIQVTKNLEQHTQLKELFSNRLSREIQSYKKTDDLIKDWLVMYLCLGLHNGLLNMESLIKNAKTFENYQSFYKSLKDSLFTPKFWCIMAELYAAEKLASGKLISTDKKITVRFAKKANNPKYDLMYDFGKDEYFVQVKTMTSLDPTMHLFSQELLKRSITKPCYRKTEWDVHSYFDYQKEDFSVAQNQNNGTTNLEERIKSAIENTLDNWEKTPDNSGELEFGEITISYKIKKSKQQKPMLLYSKAIWSAQNKETMYQIYGKVYERLLHHVYSTYLEFKDLKLSKDRLSMCRLMFVPDWANRSLYSVWEAPVFRKQACEVINAIGIDDFMKVDILYGNDS